jgi:hypothetical protein
MPEFFSCFVKHVPTWQGDQIGRIFANWVSVFFGQLGKIKGKIPKFGAAFFHDNRFILILTKKFCAIFSQTHLVTLQPRVHYTKLLKLLMG